MKRDFKEAVAHRRSHYALSSKSPISDAEIQALAEYALNNVPSPFNSQSARMVLLLGNSHIKLWDIVKNTLKAKLKPENYKNTEEKINTAFASGYGTILFFEDETVVKGLQESFPSYKDKFPQWSDHSSGMHQFAVWTMLEDAGFGASLQHYNPIIDDEVRKTWNLPESWKLLSQMPFGLSLETPEVPEKAPLSERLKIFK